MSMELRIFSNSFQNEENTFMLNIRKFSLGLSLTMSMTQIRSYDCNSQRLRVSCKQTYQYTFKVAWLRFKHSNRDSDITELKECVFWCFHLLWIISYTYNDENLIINCLVWRAGGVTKVTCYLVIKFNLTIKYLQLWFSNRKW